MQFLKTQSHWRLSESPFPGAQAGWSFSFKGDLSSGDQHILWCYDLNENEPLALPTPLFSPPFKSWNTKFPQCRSVDRTSWECLDFVLRMTTQQMPAGQQQRRNACSAFSDTLWMLCSGWGSWEAQRLLIAHLSRWKALSLTFIPVWVDAANKKVFIPFLQGVRKLWLNLFPNSLAVVLIQYNKKKKKERSLGELSLFFSLIIYFTRIAPDQDFIHCTLLLLKQRNKIKSTTTREEEIFCRWTHRQRW